MKTLIKQLATIQRKLRAPKNQFNAFSKFNYRSCEDILQAVKPLLGDCVILLHDDIICVGDRVYVKATAVITDGENSITSTAMAREPLEKKGMDSSQITGTASSYSRKYALNGLLLIDDNKEIDSVDQYESEADEYAELIDANDAFGCYMFTQSMTNEDRLGVWKSYKNTHIGKGGITAKRAELQALNEKGREEALRAKEAFDSEDGTEAQEARDEYTSEQIEFINTLSGE